MSDLRGPIPPSRPGGRYEHARQLAASLNQRGTAVGAGGMVTTKGTVPRRVRQSPPAAAATPLVWAS